jgi:hypothetical protein
MISLASWKAETWSVTILKYEHWSNKRNKYITPIAIVQLNNSHKRLFVINTEARLEFPLHQYTQMSLINSVNLFGGRSSISGRDRNFQFKPLALMSEPLALFLLQKREDVHSDQTKVVMKAGWGPCICPHALVSGSIESISFNMLVRLGLTGGTRCVYISVQQEPPVGHRTVPTVGGSVCMEWSNIFVTGELGQERCMTFVADTECNTC